MKSMRIRNIRKGWLAAMLGMMITLLGAGALRAQPAIDAGKAVSLTVRAEDPADGTPITGLTVTLFKVANMSVTGSGKVKFQLTSAFDGYVGVVDMNLDPDRMDSSSWAAGAKNLAPYALYDFVNGNKSFIASSAVVDEEGNASFYNLEQGLYLITGPSYTGKTYAAATLTPAFLTLPQWSGSEWIYEAGAKAKPEVRKTVKKISVTAKKVWSGDDSPSKRKKRPTSVTVKLVNGSGVEVDRQTLTEKNGWKFTWTGVPEDHWAVLEDVPEGYSVSEQEKTTSTGKELTVKNTSPPSGVRGESRDWEDESETDKTTKKKTSKKKSGVNGTSRQGDTASAASAERLPQTGQLWWPVWVLSGIAAVLVILGLFLRFSGKKDLKD